MDATIAHIKKSGQEPSQCHIQSLEEHTQGVAELAEKFATEFGFGEWGYAMGLLHDKGKEKSAFQNYIRKENGMKFSPFNYDEKKHAYVGALLAKKVYGQLGDIITNQIAGHHAGLYDYTELENIMTKDVPDEVDCNIDRLSLPTDVFRSLSDVSAINHLFRMLYSCLVDADWLDTERFMDKVSYEARQNVTTMQELKVRLEVKLQDFKKAPDTPVNRIRQQVQSECLKASSLPSGFFTLTVPTGGGKTISSIVWAVNHAIKNSKRRIIIAIPYTSIIVQTAAVLKGIFGEENVLEHHSNVEYDYDDDNGKNNEHAMLQRKMKLATENWDYPIIVTTNVQLFESMYSNKPSACRKLHNICNSVLILDEVQTLPTDFLQPIVDALKCYQKHFGVSVLFTTASQPILSGVIEGCNPRSQFNGIETIDEIIPKDMNLHEKLRRVELDVHNEGQTYDAVAEQLLQHDRVLCIVNTRRDAKELYDRLPEEGIKLHLSRMMCPAHVRQAIAEVKASLQDKENRVIRVIATQLIEAGVDIDFPVVYRQEAGLDSILQAAGRCNREGKLDVCTTHVFGLSKEHPLCGNSIKDANNARLNIVGKRDWFAPDTMTEYFRQLYCRRETFDKKDIKTLLYKPQEMCFETASHEFRLIDDISTPVIINWEDSLELLERLKEQGPSYSLMKQLGQYTVSIRQNDFKRLLQTGTVDEVLEGIYVIADKSQYSDKVGLLTDNHWLEEILIS